MIVTPNSLTCKNCRPTSWVTGVVMRGTKEKARLVVSTLVLGVVVLKVLSLLAFVGGQLMLLAAALLGVGFAETLQRKILNRAGTRTDLPAVLSGLVCAAVLIHLVDYAVIGNRADLFKVIPDLLSLGIVVLALVVRFWR